MRITVFTSNQPRHINLINGLSTIAEEVYAVQECNTIFPGKVADFFKKSAVMQEYFKHVMESERNVFGDVRFINPNVRTLSVKSGDLNDINLSVLGDALQSDYYIVFGASYIKGDLIEFLIDNRAYNIHMGISPYYRGSSCNFWAPFDGNPEFVGATIHLLSKGLDSGDMLYHALPKAAEYKPFDLGMIAVKAAHDSLVDAIRTKKINEYQPIKQDKALHIRYTRNADFTDDIALKYLQSLPAPRQIFMKLKTRDMGKFLNPYISE